MRRLFTILFLLLISPLATAQAKVTTYYVGLTWAAPLSSPDPVAGYNAYRSPSGAGAWQVLNSTVIGSAAYNDTSVLLGGSYDYIVKSVDAQGVESAPSNIATATIPLDNVPVPARPTVTTSP